jgi:hypothetical protein
MSCLFTCKLRGLGFQTPPRMLEVHTKAAKPVNHAQILRLFADLIDFYFYTCLLRPLLTRRHGAA